MNRELVQEVVRDKFQGGLFGQSDAAPVTRGPLGDQSAQAAVGKTDIKRDLEQLQEDVDRLTSWHGVTRPMTSIVHRLA